MELSLIELQLITDFRKLSPNSQQQLIQQLETLRRRPANDSEIASPANQCPLKTQTDTCPDSGNDAIITE